MSDISKSSKIRSAVLGAAGYSGAELCALLSANPYFELSYAFDSGYRDWETQATKIGRAHV